eukprot:gene3210-4021_t
MSHLVSLEYLDLSLYCSKGYKLLPNVIPKTVIDFRLSIIMDYFFLEDDDNDAQYYDEDGVDSIIQLQDCLVTGSIPSSVRKLSIQYDLIQHDIHGLVPDSVTYLTIHKWTPPLVRDQNNSCFPKSVRKLQLYSDELANLSPGIFPSTITDLILDLDSENRTKAFVMPHVVPSSVQRLHCDVPVTLDPHSIPFGVKSLKISSKSVLGPDGKPFIPPSVQELLITDYSYKIPEWLYRLDLLVNLTTLECPIIDIKIGMLPNKLEKLTVRRINSIEPGSLPNSLKSIVFAEVVKFKIETGILPNSLETLEFIYGAAFFPSIPLSLTHLVYSYTRNTNNAPIPVGGLPESLKRLTLRNMTENAKEFMLIAGILPQNLEILDLSRFSKLDLDVDQVVIPKSVREISLPYSLKSKAEQYSQILFKLFSEAESTLDVKFNLNELVLSSLDKDDPYLYFVGDCIVSDGFILKSDLQSFISIFLKDIN